MQKYPHVAGLQMLTVIIEDKIEHEKKVLHRENINKKRVLIISLYSITGIS